MKHMKRQDAFTIVELLIVIVVIGILASIAVVSYNGISKKAIIAGLQSDLSGSAKKIENYKVTSSDSQYPGSLEASGVTLSSDTTVAYRNTAGTAFCLSLTRSNISFYIDNGGVVKAGSCGAQTSFAYDTTLANCATTVQLPVTSPNSSVGSIIDWGDGTTSSLSSSLQSHTYASEGAYTVSYNGPVLAIDTTNVASANQGCLVAINQWKDGIAPTKLNLSYSSNLIAVATPPSSITDMSSMFYYASNFNQPIDNWNTSNVTSMYGMFTYASAFNQPLGSWNTSNVTDMTNMFTYAGAFNQPIGNWNVSKVTTMSGMFSYASAFNQPIVSWNTSSVTNMQNLFTFAGAFNQPLDGWNTSNVTNMYGLFAYAGAFNQPIGSWNTTKATNMEAMFISARAFNQPLGSWNTSNVTTMRSMFTLASSYNQNLSTWNVAALTERPPTNFSASASAWVLPKPNF